MIICTLVAVAALPAGNSKRVKNEWSSKEWLSPTQASEWKAWQESEFDSRTISKWRPDPWSFCASTVARLVLGGSRATYRLSVFVDHPRSFLKALSILFRVGFPHKNTERPASQSCSLPSPQHSVEYGWFHRAQIERCSDSIGLSHNLRLLLVYYYGEISSISEIGLSYCD